MSKVQSIHFSRQYWTATSSKSKLDQMGYKALKAMHTTPNFYEYRLEQPDLFHHFVIKKRNPGIQLVVGFYAPKVKKPPSEEDKKKKEKKPRKKPIHYDL